MKLLPSAVAFAVLHLLLFICAVVLHREFAMVVNSIALALWAGVLCATCHEGGKQ